MSQKGRIPSILLPKYIANHPSPLRPIGFCSSPVLSSLVRPLQHAPLFLTALQAPRPLPSPLHSTPCHSTLETKICCLFTSLSHHCLQIEVNPHTRSSVSWSQSTFAISFPSSVLRSHAQLRLASPASLAHCLSSRGPPSITLPCWTYTGRLTRNPFPSSSSFKAHVVTPLPGLP